jgi:hypothetical protein
MKIKLIKEINDDLLDRIDLRSRIASAKENMKDVFGDDWRIVIPMVSSIDDGNRDDTTRDHIMLRYIEDVEKSTGYKVDFSQPFGLAYKDIESTHDGKTYTTRRKVKIGPLISDLGPVAADFWLKNNKFYTTKANALYFQEKSKYVIILSRHPIDVLRMSDHSTIESCHSTDKEYFKCAVTEARRGGGVAYVVEKEDLEPKVINSRGDVASPDLQADELFYDQQRGVGDIVPVSRLRLRQIENTTTKMRLVIPDLRVYGIDLALTSYQVKNFLIDKQKEKINSLKNTQVEAQDYIMLGGTYVDHPREQLLKNFFLGIDSITVNPGWGFKSSQADDTDFIEPDEPPFYEQAEEFIIDNFGRPNRTPFMRAYNFSYDQGNDDDYIFVFASFEFKNINTRKTSYNEEREIVRIFQNAFESSHGWDMSYTEQRKGFIIEISQSIFDLDELDTFLSWLHRCYDDHEDREIEFRNELRKKKFVNDVTSSMFRFKPKNLENYEAEQDEDEIKITFQKGSFIELQKISEKYSSYRTKIIALNGVQKFNNNLEFRVQKFIDNYKADNYDPNPVQQSLNLNENYVLNVLENWDQDAIYEAKSSIKFEIDCKIDNDYYKAHDTSDHFLNYLFSITINNSRQEVQNVAVKIALQIVNMLDRNIHKLKQEAENYVIDEIENDMMR